MWSGRSTDGKFIEVKQEQDPFCHVHPTAHKRPCPGRGVCSYRARVYHGVRHPPAHQLRPWRSVHARGISGHHCPRCAHLSGPYRVQPALSLLVTVIVSMVFCAAYGAVIERVAYRPLRNAAKLAPLISAVGMSIILQNFVMLDPGQRIQEPAAHASLGRSSASSAPMSPRCRSSS